MSKAALILPPIILGIVVDAMNNAIDFNVVGLNNWLFLFAFAALIQVFFIPLKSSDTHQFCAKSCS